MKRGQELTGTVEKLSFPNKGLAVTEDGSRIKVKGVLPGQKILLRVKKSGKDRAEGNLIEVLEKSPDEIESSCPHFGLCGGCTYQTLSYDYQLKLKESMVHDLLAPVLGQETWQDTFEGVKASPKQFCYRNKMEFSFGDEYKDGPLSLGMHKKGSFYDVVNVSECQIVDQDFRTILSATLDFFSDRKVPYRHKDGSGYLRHLLVRKAAYTGEILVDIITTTDVGFLNSMGDSALLEAYRDCLLSQHYEGKLVGILHTRNDSPADVVEDQGTDILYGQDYFYEKLLGLLFKITPFSFFQTNSMGAELLYDTARGFIRDATGNSLENKVVYDLYSGTGTIAQILSPVAGRVIGVEIVEEAVEAAKENAELNNLSNCQFIAGDVLKVLDDIDERPDFIVLDPPRDGIHPKALTKIIGYGVDKLIYISCKPSSLARDLEVFKKSGYEVKRVACVDMFPGTYHVETVCLLSKKVQV